MAVRPVHVFRPSTLDEWTDYGDGIGVVRGVLRVRVVVVGWVAGLRLIGAGWWQQRRGLHGVDRPHVEKRGLAAARFAGERLLAIDGAFPNLVGCRRPARGLRGFGCGRQ